eukprot:TRINITY_DN468_c0_g1_i1.p1 TRINITY_DN468_c0_g1~~TRINITY_DN468_c0_g1_i1.p1  ORF type:complete len:475 (+),score=126.24 TRINITY_DN468_c0_g1_i1:309-1733(+)
MDLEDNTVDATGKNRSVDYVALDATIETQRKLAVDDGKVNEAIEALLNSEKQMRLLADVTGTKKVVVAIIQICHEVNNWKLLNENIVLLSKRRAQLKQAVAAMVREAMSYIDAAPDLDTRIELIKTLNTVTAGKIYVEIERARLTKKLAAIKEGQGQIKEAAIVMQEVAVETFGAMAKTEKIAFILEQVRLCLDHDDYMRAQILSKKVNPRVFDEPKEGEKKKPKEGETVLEAADTDVPPLPVLKRKYYELMIRYYNHSRDYLEIARCYQSIYDSPAVTASPEEWMPVLRKICWYLLLAPHGSMQSSLLHATSQDKRLQELPKFQALLKQFTTMEVIQWPQLQKDFQAEMAEETDVFGGKDGHKATEDIRQRVTEQNILVVSKYYSRITLKRLAQLLDLSVDDTEKHLSEMVVSKALFAKIERPTGNVSFRAPQDSNEVLNGWVGNIEKLLELVESSCHQIHKEAMVHKVTLQA